MSHPFLAIALCVAARATLRAVRVLGRRPVAGTGTEPLQEASEAAPAVNLARLEADLLVLAAEMEPQGYASLTILQFREQIETVGTTTDFDTVPLLATVTVAALRARAHQREEIRQRLIAAGQGEWVS